MSIELKNKVENKNELDIELYQFALEEIYPKYIAKYPHSLTKELTEFEKMNMAYKYNSLRQHIKGK